MSRILMRIARVMMALSFVACGGEKTPPSDAHTNAESSPSEAAQPPPAAPAAPEACHVFTIVRPATVAMKEVATFIVHGNKPTSLVTLTKEGGELVAMTAGELEGTLCRVLPPNPYLVHVMKEDGKVVGEVMTPTAAPDAGHDARALCDAQREGAKLGVPAKEQLAAGMQQAAGSLTTPKYRDLLFGALHGDKEVTLALLVSLDHDIREQGHEAFERCTLLVKK